MTTSVQRRGWMSKILLGAASAALALAVVLGLGVATIQWAQAQTFTDLYNFTGSSGVYPYGGLVRDAKGNLYSTTSSGGASGYGVVFKVNKSGKETVLYSFCPGGYPCPSGRYPFAGLVRDKAGTLYGTTYSGGTYDYGVVFEVDKNGKETVLYSFTGGSDGRNPVGGLLRDKAGILYGTTGNGGAYGYGNVFELDKNGKETVLHSFAGGSSDGEYPYYTNLLMDKNGNLYGVTQNGGGATNCGNGGCGVVYKLSKSGTLTVLHSFGGETTDGCYPFGTPAMDKMGNLYGTTNECGASSAGIVWKVSQSGTETVLHNFAGGMSDGANPYAGVIMDAKGNLYGDTDEGGASGDGTVYELNKKGTLTVLHSFAGSDGAYPYDNLIRDAKGNFYGTASEGGNDSDGTVWKLSP